VADRANANGNGNAGHEYGTEKSFGKKVQQNVQYFVQHNSPEHRKSLELLVKSFWIDALHPHHSAIFSGAPFT
jgi:hypothetical protein